MEEANVTSCPGSDPFNGSTSWNASEITIQWKIPLMHWAIISISPLGFVENGVLLWFLCFRIRRSPFTVYITHLALADFCLLFCIFILSVDSMIYIENTSSYYTVVTLSATFLFGYNSGLYLLTAISVERCLSVLHPIWYRCHRPKHQSGLVCTFLWTLSSLVTILEYATCMKNDDTEEHCRAVIIFTVILNFLVFMPLMLVSSIILVVKIRRNTWVPHSSKFYLIIVVSILVFLIFALPMKLLCLLNFQDWANFSDLHQLSLLFSTINSSANPFIYFFVGSSRKKRFQESLKVVLTRAFKDEMQPHSQEDRATEHTVDTVV
ncbi:proto-oncogene Mas [Suncus etruscus]|uniref:proto-oncogene Mas n=1 Tax=Suncus etruscus TaxID=109475 RepID=UPI00210F4880|nr:proto-oncogene Mas [Suncus etruscus]